VTTDTATRSIYEAHQTPPELLGTVLEKKVSPDLNKLLATNYLKARCKSGSRATIIPTAYCDNPRCQRIFQAMLTFYQEIAPPISNPDHQFSFWEYADST
jgi:hypothetical protein